MSATIPLKHLFECIVSILIFSNSAKTDHVTFEDVSLSTQFEHLTTINKSNSLKEYLPKYPLQTVIITGKIPILYGNSVTDIDNVKKLEFLRNGIAEIQPGAFKNLVGVHSLWFVHQQLKVIEEGVFDDLQIEELHLNHNPLSRISKISDNLPNLIYLSFNNNEIETIEDDAFEKLQNLKVLDLTANRIRSLPNGIFENLPNLTTVLLVQNQISSFEKEVFRSQSLQDLDLRVNQLTTISEQVFTSLPKLVRIALSYNNLKNISKGVLTSKSLTKVELSECNINFIDPEAFDGLPSLVHVTLSGNELAEYNVRWFANTPNVSELFFTRNYITEIPEGAFGNLGNHQEFVINFNFNKIRTVSPNSFKGLKKIKWLGLVLNGLEVWDGGFLEDVEEIGVLHLMDNRIRCIDGDFRQIFKANVTHLDGNPLSVECLKRIEDWESRNPGRVTWRN